MCAYVYHLLGLKRQDVPDSIFDQASKNVKCWFWFQRCFDVNVGENIFDIACVATGYHWKMGKTCLLVRENMLVIEEIIKMTRAPRSVLLCETHLESQGG